MHHIYITTETMTNAYHTVGNWVQIKGSIDPKEKTPRIKFWGRKNP